MPSSNETAANLNAPTTSRTAKKRHAVKTSKAKTAEIMAETERLKAEIEKNKTETAKRESRSASIEAKTARLRAISAMMDAFMKKFAWYFPAALTLFLATKSGLAQLEGPDAFDFQRFFKEVGGLLVGLLVGCVGGLLLTWVGTYFGEKWIGGMFGRLEQQLEPRPERTEAPAIALPAPPPPYAA
ncbi:hypothetical protein HK104_004620 [Borealophlyctis nickersoniae]|nr:hypothetical protein HK104_004620 [Borealophlyctis nickersoniae]